MWIASPLYIIFFVRSLSASDAWIGLQSTTANIATIFGYALSRWILVRWGEPRTLKRAALTLGMYPILVGLFPNLTLIIFASALNSFFSSGFNLSQFNQLILAMPEEKRPEYTALYYTTTNMGAFIFPLIGVSLASLVGIGPTLIGCGFLSLLGGASFWFSPVITSTKTAGNLAIKRTLS